MNGDSFVGGNFLWFTGVIEDVKDPEEMGRYRVRCFGYHTDNKGLIATKDLPWANVMMPITSASTSGIGQSATGLVQGSWVIGFFRDGSNAQDPIIMGSIPSMFDSRPSYDVGFTDPDKTYPIADTLGKPDTPQPARIDYKDSAVYKSKELTYNDLFFNVEDKFPNYGKTANGGEDWDLKNLEQVGPSYPKNHVQQTESGHVIEYDDTTGKERISIFHKSGTYDEITSDDENGGGDKTLVIQGDGYEVVIKNKNVYIKGDLNLTVDRDMRTKVNGDYELEVSGNVNINAVKPITITSAVKTTIV